MTHWFFASYAAYQANPYPVSDGLSPETAWFKGTNHTDSRAVKLNLFQPGDTLWILDNHGANLIDGYLQGTFPTAFTIRGDYPGRPGTLKVLGINSTQAITVQNLGITSGSLGCTNVSGLLLNGLEVSYQSKGFVASQTSHVDNVTIRNSVFHHLTHEGIECFARLGYSRNNWLIENNQIYDVGYDTSVVNQDYEGIGIQRLTNSVIRGNRIYRCKYGINMWESGDGSLHDIVIEDNRIYDISGGVPSWPSRGIMLSGGASQPSNVYNLTVRNNVVYRIGKEGLRLPIPVGSQGCEAIDNIVADVNQEFGIPNTDFFTGQSGWTVSENLYFVSV